MGRTIKDFLVLLFIVSLSLSALMIQAHQDQEKIREEVRVVNVEVPVRVMLKGKAVANLKKTDFKLFENGREQNIHGFYSVRKMIKSQKYDLIADRIVKRKPRYFVLVFRVSHFNENLQKSIKNFLQNALFKQDRLLLFINDQTMYFNQIADTSNVYALIEKNLTEQCQKAKHRFEKYYLKVKQAIDLTRFQALLSNSDREGGLITDDVILFMENYLAIWKEYKEKYLLPDIDTFYNFAHLLEKINLEKWVISFYQFEKFPELKFTGEIRSSIRALISNLQIGRSEDAVKSRIISKLLSTADRELKVSSDFPSEEISKLFYKVNATFHSLFFTTYNNVLSKDLEFSEINTDLENTLRLITEKTGGELLVSNKLDTSLKRVVETEDIFYILTYAPENPDKIGRIRVKVNNRKFQVIYDDNIRADYISTYLKKRKSELTDIKLEGVKFENKVLLFNVADVVVRTKNGKKSGMVTVHVQIKDDKNNTLFDQSKLMNPDNTRVNVKINMGWLKQGTYNLVIDVEDLYTRKSAFTYLNLEV